MSWQELDSDDRYVLYRKGWNPDEESLLKSLKTTGWAVQASSYRTAVAAVSWEFVVLAPDEDGSLAVVASQDDEGSFLATLAVLDESVLE